MSCASSVSKDVLQCLFDPAMGVVSSARYLGRRSDIVLTFISDVSFTAATTSPVDELRAVPFDDIFVGADSARDPLLVAPTTLDDAAGTSALLQAITRLLRMKDRRRKPTWMTATRDSHHHADDFRTFSRVGADGIATVHVSATGIRTDSARGCLTTTDLALMRPTPNPTPIIIGCPYVA